MKIPIPNVKLCSTPPILLRFDHSYANMTTNFLIDIFADLNQWAKKGHFVRNNL